LVDLTVTTPSGTSGLSAADEFTYEAVPTVTAVSPAACLTVAAMVPKWTALAPANPCRSSPPSARRRVSRRAARL